MGKNTKSKYNKKLIVLMIKNRKQISQKVLIELNIEFALQKVKLLKCYATSLFDQ